MLARAGLQGRWRNSRPLDPPHEDPTKKAEKAHESLGARRLQLLAQVLHDERKAEATKWRYPPTQTYAHCRQAAYDFLAESHLHAWLQNQNYDTGIAPTTEELVTECARRWPHSGVPGIWNTALFLLAPKSNIQAQMGTKVVPPMESFPPQAHIFHL